MGFDWDDELPLQVKTECVQLLDEMQKPSNVTFARCLLIPGAVEPPQMHQPKLLGVAHTSGRRTQTKLMKLN